MTSNSIVPTIHLPALSLRIHIRTYLAGIPRETAGAGPPGSGASTSEAHLRRAPTLALLPLLLLCCALDVRAQSPAAGERIRVVVPCVASGTDGIPVPGGCLVDGHLAGVGRDTLEIDYGGVTRDLPLAAVARLEVRRPRGSRWLAGTGIGFGAGALAAWLVLHTGGSTSLCDRSANQDAVRPIECAGVAALVGGVPVGALGAWAGSRIRRWVWEEVPVERLGILVVPGAGGPRLGLVLGLR